MDSPKAQTPAAPSNEAEILRAAVAVLTGRLPKGWAARLVGDDGASSPRRDARLVVTAPDERSVTLMLEAKRVVEGRDVPALRERFQQRSPDTTSVVAARYLSPRVRSRLVEAGLSYVDATGNVFVNVPLPGLYVDSRGADSDPWRGPGRPRGSLKGTPAARLVRTLLDFDASWRIRELVKVAGVSTGSTYRVVDFLEREGLVTRDATTALVVPDWVALLRRWSDDYGFVRSNQTTRWLAPRGLSSLTNRLASISIQYAVTGTLAAANWAEYAPARSAMIYVSDASTAAKLLDLRAVDAGANVMLAEPDSDVPFIRSEVSGYGVTIAAPTQVAVDLMTGPGRNPAEAEALVEWMTEHESSWRR